MHRWHVYALVDKHVAHLCRTARTKMAVHNLLFVTSSMPRPYTGKSSMIVFS